MGVHKKNFLVYVFLSFLIITIPLLFFNSFYEKKDNFVHIENLKQLEHTSKDADIILDEDIDLSTWNGNAWNVKSIDGQGHRIYNSPTEYKGKSLFSNLLKMSNITFDNVNLKIESSIQLENHSLSSDFSPNISQMEAFDESLVFKNIKFKNNNYDLFKSISDDNYYSPIISKISLNSINNWNKDNNIFFSSFENIIFMNNNININLQDTNYNPKEFYASTFANFVFPSRSNLQSNDTHRFVLNLSNIFFANNTVNFESKTAMSTNHYANLVSINTNSFNGDPLNSDLTNFEIYINDIFFENNRINLNVDFSSFVYGEFISTTKNNRFYFKFNEFKNIILLNQLSANGVNLIESDESFYNLFSLLLSSESNNLIQNNLSTIWFSGINFSRQRNVNYFINSNDDFQDVFKVFNLNQNDAEFIELSEWLFNLYNPYMFNFIWNETNDLKAIRINANNNVLITTNSKANGKNGKAKSLNLQINLLLNYENSLLIGNANSITLKNINIQNSDNASLFSAKQVTGKNLTNQFDIKLNSTNKNGWSNSVLEQEELYFSFSVSFSKNKTDFNLKMPLSIDQIQNIDFSGIYIASVSSQTWFILLMVSIGILIIVGLSILIYWVLKKYSIDQKLNYENNYYNEWNDDYGSYENEFDEFEYYRGTPIDQSYNNSNINTMDETYYETEIETNDAKINSTLDAIDVNPNPTKRKIVVIEKVFPRPESKIISEQSNSFDYDSSTLNNDLNASDYETNLTIINQKDNYQNNLDTDFDETILESYQPLNKTKIRQTKSSKRVAKKLQSTSVEEDEILSTYL